MYVTCPGVVVNSYAKCVELLRNAVSPDVQGICKNEKRLPHLPADDSRGRPWPGRVYT